MAKKLPYFCWFPADFEVDENVKLMSIEQIGLYAVCLNHCWLNGSLPQDPLEIARAMKLPKAQFLRAWKRVSPCFQQNESTGRWTNRRQESERENAHQVRAKKREGGQMTAAKRWGSDLPSDSLATIRVSDSDSVSGSKDSEGDARGVEMRPEWDDQFSDFQALFAKSAAKPLIQQDWDEAWYPWRILDFEQKKEVIQSVYGRIAAGQQIFHKPGNYISKQEYRRPVRAAVTKIRSVMEGV